jgi:hypothetical protein
VQIVRPPAGKANTLQLHFEDPLPRERVLRRQANLRVY